MLFWQEDLQYLEVKQGTQVNPDSLEQEESRIQELIGGRDSFPDEVVTFVK